ncbi:MAG: PQQ-binding-like beta-propeller repeat protein [Candidatus Thermoplasmatota archaeon]
MKTKAYIIVLMLIFATGTSVAATGTFRTPQQPQQTTSFWWPQYGYDSANTGFTPSAAPSTNELFLQARLDPFSNAVAYSGGVVVDGKLYVGFQNGAFYCTNAYNGNIIWKKNPGELGNSIQGTPLVEGNNIYIGIDSTMYCFDKTTGAQQWMYTTGGTIRGSATTISNQLLFGSTDKKLYCLDLTSGSFIWSFTAVDQIFTTPAVTENYVFFAASKPNYAGYPTGRIYCLSVTTGTKIWEYRTYSPVTPVTLYNNKIYAGAYNRLICLDGTTGTELWLEEFPAGFFSGISAAYGNLYFATYAATTNKAYCYNATTGTQVWSYSDITSAFAPSIADNKIIINHVGTFPDYKIYCFDAAGDGSGSTTIVWQYLFNEQPRGQPVIANNRVWVILDKTWVYGFGLNEPPSTPVINGPNEGEIGVNYQFNFTMSDPEGQFVALMIDWNDGTPLTWTSYYDPQAYPIYLASHTYTTGGDYQIKAKAKDIYNKESSWSTPHLFTINRPPVRPAAPEGPSTGYVQTEYTFTAVTTDPNDDMISYQFNWGDGTTTEWTPFVPSGTPVSASHSWNLPATYQVRVRARDTKNATTDLSPGHPIQIQRMPIPELQINSIKGGIGVSAVLKNNGDGDATNINYKINLSGGVIILGKETTGTIDLLKPGDQVTIKSGLILGFGKTTITVTASCSEGMNAEATAKGTVVLIFVVGVAPPQ